MALRTVPVRFLADATGQVMLEIYNNPQAKAPDYASMDPSLPVQRSSRDRKPWRAATNWRCSEILGDCPYSWPIAQTRWLAVTERTHS